MFLPLLDFSLPDIISISGNLLPSLFAMSFFLSPLWWQGPALFVYHEKYGAGSGIWHVLGTTSVSLE